MQNIVTRLSYDDFHQAMSLTNSMQAIDVLPAHAVYTKHRKKLLLTQHGYLWGLLILTHDQCS